MMKYCLRLAAVALCALTATAEDGRFWQLHWFEPGVEHGNPMPNPRFRVNSPEVMLHPSFGKRNETKSSGMMQIHTPEDLFALDAAELYLEIWGGHPATARKRVTLNGRTTYDIPETGTAAKNCTHLYPTIPIKITDLVNGYNAVQFACDQGTSFWGHFIVENACLRAGLKPEHPSLQAAGLAGCRYAVKASPDGERMGLSLDTTPACLAAVSSVDFQTSYEGYRENGSIEPADWHGFTKHREPVAFAGRASAAPFRAAWDVSMLPDQKNMAARAWVRFAKHPDLVYVTAATTGLATPARRGRVRLYGVRELPKPFWSRAGKRIPAEIDLDVDPATLERADLHVVVWDGGSEKPGPFTLNGEPLKVTGSGRHDVIYTVVPIDPKMLKKGSNLVELQAHTEHHGIEILLPGPAIAVRTK
ncbi:MAG TPA: hypothetical protein VN442_03685 [Bryobacteraceae bacterium]|nr:hypothetical protein [Bryobacteraceae bacterium]